MFFYSFLLYSSKLCIGIRTSKSFALSINTLLIFDIQLVNGVLFLNAENLFLMSIIPLPFAFVRVIVPFTRIYVSLKLHRCDLSIDVLHLICLLGLHLSSALLDWSWTSIHFSVISNLGTLSDVVPYKFVIFWYSIFIWYHNNLNSSIICCLFFGGMYISCLSSSFSLLLVLHNLRFFINSCSFCRFSNY